MERAAMGACQEELERRPVPPRQCPERAREQAGAIGAEARYALGMQMRRQESVVRRAEPALAGRVGLKGRWLIRRPGAALLAREGEASRRVAVAIGAQAV